MDEPNESLSQARLLWSAARHGVLGTQSEACPGYPFGSVVPFVLGRDGLPLLLLSPLSQHTRNIDRDPHCSLTLTTDRTGDVQQQPRLTALGDVGRVDPGDEAERYLRYFPQARDYHVALGFLFYRFTPIRFHWNGGFATARWLGIDRLVRANPLSGPIETRIVEHMNADHRDALRTYLDNTGDTQETGDEPVEMLGIDADGMDLRSAGTFHRVPLASPIDSAEQARRVLVDMAQGEP